MDTGNKKPSATEKKYGKIVGKLFWEQTSDYNYDLRRAVTKYELLMVTGIYRQWGGGRFMYSICNPSSTEEYRRDWKINCSRFEYYCKHGRYVPVDPSHPEPPATTEE